MPPEGLSFECGKSWWNVLLKVMPVLLSFCWGDGAVWVNGANAQASYKLHVAILVDSFGHFMT